MADDYESMADAYLSAAIGSNPPELMVVKGSMILERRPDLKGDIDPGKTYHVTKDEIREVE